MRSSATTSTTATGRNAGAVPPWSASSCRDSARLTSALPARSSFGFQAFFERRVNELGDVAAESGDLAHQGGRDEHVLLRGREEHGLHVVVEVEVHAGELDIVLNIRQSEQDAQTQA